MIRDPATDREEGDTDALGVVRHDLKNALTAIRGRAGLAERHARRVGCDGPEMDKLLADFAALEAAVQEMAERIEQVRAASRVEGS